MSTFVVHRVRKQALPLDPSHEHVIGVLTEDGAFHSNQEVAESIARGDTWRAATPDGREASIRVEPFCTRGWCMLAPYLATVPSETLATSLEKLPQG